MTISVVIAVYNQLALTRACLDSLRGTSEEFELCVVDNGSSDGTAEYFARWAHPFPCRYHRNADNAGLIRALNQGAAMAAGDVLCFLHNDTEMKDVRWLSRLRGALDADGVGLAGLYGARRLRRDGRFAGSTIVHCLQPGGNVRGDSVEVAAVDGVCLAARRPLFDAIGGFDESYGFFHGYDRDLSFAIRETGHTCVVVNSPFIHRGGGTRTSPDAPTRPPEDLAQRRKALRHFATKWKHRLPSDVRTLKERITARLGL
jgi:O-antigen biosynthesis protein